MVTRVRTLAGRIQLRALLVVIITLALTVPAQTGDRYITLASTTSTEQSGLFAHIIPRFREATGIDVRVVAVGTGQAFSIGRRGDADALLVHDPAGEEAFVGDGYGSERRDVMYNYFIIVGPRTDPADIAGVENAVDAMSRIAGTRSAFASRGDDSGTHRAELRLWGLADIQPSGSWYRELGSGMGPTLNTAAGMDAYAVADRASWASFRNRQNLVLLFEGDDVLLNKYASVPVSPRRHPHVRHELALRWHRWLLSDQGQQAIAEFRVDGQAVFFPGAD